MNWLYTPIMILLGIEAYQFIISFLPSKARMSQVNSFNELVDSDYYYVMLIDIVCSLGWALCLVDAIATPELRSAGVAISLYYGIRILTKDFMTRPVWLVNLLDCASVFGLSYLTLAY